MPSMDLCNIKLESRYILWSSVENFHLEDSFVAAFFFTEQQETIRWAHGIGPGGLTKIVAPTGQHVTAFDNHE